MTGIDRDQMMARKGRIVALVIAAGGLFAILAPLFVSVFGLEQRFEMLFYFGSLAAFVWALVNSFQLWRARHVGDEKEEG